MDDILFETGDKDGFIAVETCRVGEPLSYVESLASRFKSEVIKSS